ncbi:unnamed protein product [Parnassius apollo]|uniref:(apollo) hypothetical protein n=1 Tax=Parnassius apollo TaxID=110799 RepID=A0A8S3WA79_PARAO|nr:unnamed protein product [Parnassius apollo]
MNQNVDRRPHALLVSGFEPDELDALLLHFAVRTHARTYTHTHVRHEPERGPPPARAARFRLRARRAGRTAAALRDTYSRAYLHAHARSA